MNREEIEKKFDEKFWIERTVCKKCNLFWYNIPWDQECWNCWNLDTYKEFESDQVNQRIKSFFLDEILPEVLVNILIPVDITDCDNWYCTWVSISWKRLSNNKILWYNQCIQDIKDNAKEKYNITL